MALKSDRPLSQQEAGRKCLTCPATLSVYNPYSQCNRCLSGAARAQMAASIPHQQKGWGRDFSFTPSSAGDPPKVAGEYPTIEELGALVERECGITHEQLLNYSRKEQYYIQVARMIWGYLVYHDIPGRGSNFGQTAKELGWQHARVRNAVERIGDAAHPQIVGAIKRIRAYYRPSV